MTAIRQATMRFLRDETGITVTEYGLLIAIIGVIAAAAVKLGAPLIMKFLQDGTNDLTANVG